jgi:transcriptional regulator with XRE-family HTH domain
MSLGSRIYEIRQSRNLTQAQIAKKTGLAVSYLSRIENNHIEPSFSTLQKIAEALEVNLIDFFGYEPHKKPRERCPISLSGECIMNHIYSGGGKRLRIDPERYTPGQIQLLQMANYLILFGNRKMQEMLGLLLTSFLGSPLVRKDRDWLTKLTVAKNRSRQQA